MKYFLTKTHLVSSLGALIMTAMVVSIWPACGDSGSSSSASSSANSASNDGADDQALDCHCNDRSCGPNICGASCGECADDDSQVCWGGTCVDSESQSCDVNNFSATTQVAFTRMIGGVSRLHWIATNRVEGGVDISGDDVSSTEDIPFTAFDKISLELAQDAFFEEGEVRTGVFPLSSANAQMDCDLCVKAYSYCNDKGCGRTFVPDEGEIEIIKSGEPDSLFHAVLRNVKLTQVTLDKATGNTKPIVNGQTWCLGDYTVTVQVPEMNQSDDNCVAEGTGNLIDDNIKDFTLTNCLGQEVNLHSRCGFMKAVWIVAVSGW